MLPKYRLSVGLLATYAFLAVITGWMSFYPRSSKIADAAGLQQTIWENLDARGKAGVNQDYLAKIHSSRILFPALMQLGIQLGVPGDKSFSLLRLVSIFITYVFFHLYLRQWFRDDRAFCGTLFLAATVPLTFNNEFEIPTDFPEILVFTAGFWAMFKARYAWLCAIVLIGTLNRESAAMLPFFLFFATCSLKRAGWLAPVVSAGLCWLIPLLILRWWTGALEPHGYGKAFQHNLPGLRGLWVNPHPYNNYLFWLYLFGAFWFLPFVGWLGPGRRPQASQAFRRMLMGLPICVTICFVVGGYFDEPRELVGLYPLLTPASLIALFPDTQVGNSN